MNPPAIVSFTGRYAFLSNFAASPIFIRGAEFATVEHAFQSWKMTSLEHALLVKQCSTPGSAKRLARALPLRSDWNQIKLAVMYECCKVKFSDGHMRSQLLATGDSILIEGNTWGDDYWGHCTARGQNWLGKILMSIRREVA